MPWNNRLNNNYRKERPSTPIYALRKEGKFEEAYQLALRLYQKSSSDDINKAFSWVLIDLCKKFILEQNLSNAQTYFNQLSSIQFEYEDEFIETIKKQIHLLKLKIDINYSEIQKAEELSKNGNSREALEIFNHLISQNKLTDLHHESYGWIIYRFIKDEENNLSSINVKTFLRDYLNLKNERPSILHSMILNFALNYSKTHNDFIFYNFFLLWKPDYLRNEDLNNEFKDGKVFPSLISRICREFTNSNTNINIEEFLNKLNLDKDIGLDFLREAVFWNILNTHKENKFSDLWNLFDIYNKNYSKHGQSKWHSEILNLAVRFMKENDEIRFFDFFKNWNPENLNPDDWKETKKDEHIYKPLGTKAIKKAYSVLKTQTSEQDLSWLIKPYEIAIKLFPEDEWLLREIALLYFKNNEIELAIKIYKKLVLELSDKYYVWQEFSDCMVFDNSLRIGMLSKALSLEKNEDFLGDVHLDLAKSLINENLLENAYLELEAYKKHREIKGWKLSSLYDDFYNKVHSIKTDLKNNQELYKKFIPFAENFAFDDFNWTEVVLVDRWENEKGEERLTFTDGKNIEFVISKNRFEVLKQSELGQILKFKLHKQEIKKEIEGKFAWLKKTIVTDNKYFPLIAEKTEKHDWEILEDTFAVVEYINKEKNVIHAITTDKKEVFFPQIKCELQIGDFVKAKIFTKKIKDEYRTELRQIQKIEKSTIISKFQTHIAVVDGVNEPKQLFHFVITSNLQGIVKFTETYLRPKEGDFIKLSFATKTDKDRKLRVKVLAIEPTDELSPNLRKDVTGILDVRFKNDNRLDFDSKKNDEIKGSKIDENTNLINNAYPDFAFIGDYYVPKYLLEKLNILNICYVKARIIYTGNKWKVIDIEKIK